MLIVIPEDFLTLNDGSLQFLACVENLMTATYEGNHYVLFEKPLVARDIATNCKISERSRAALLNSAVSSRGHIALINLVKKYPRIVSFKGKKCNPSLQCSNSAEIDLTLFENASNVLPCKLLCEDSQDGKIYVEYFNAILKLENKAIPADIKFNILHGGGSRTPQIYKEEFNLNSLVLCIVDNDSKEPDGKGNYWTKLQSVGECNYAKFRVVCGHEIENSIPISMLSDICISTDNTALYKIVLKSVESNLIFHLYLDFKKGIVKKELRKLPHAYRRDLVNFLINGCALDSSLFSCLKEKCADSCDQCLVAMGLGENLIEIFSQKFFALSTQKKQECLARSSAKLFLGQIYDDAVAFGLASKKMRV